MLQPGEIREHLVDRLTAIFGAPKNPDGLAAELAKHIAKGVSSGDLTGLADRLIKTRRTKGFPAASELITAVKTIAPTGLAAIDGGAAFATEINADGPMPTTWILAHDPRWGALCRIARSADRQCKPFAMTSKHAPGLGRWFRTEHVRALPITDAERDVLTKLYAVATKEAAYIAAAAVKPSGAAA